MKKSSERKPRTWLDKDGLPTRSGVYLVKFRWNESSGEEEIDVYRHPIKGYACFSEDFGSGGTDAISDDTDCHVSVQCSGITFIRRLRNFSYFGHQQGAGEPTLSKKERREARRSYRKLRTCQ